MARTIRNLPPSGRLLRRPRFLWKLRDGNQSRKHVPTDWSDKPVSAWRETFGAKSLRLV